MVIIHTNGAYNEDCRNQKEGAAEHEEPDVVRWLISEGVQLQLAWVTIEDEDVNQHLSRELSAVEHRGEDPPELQHVLMMPLDSKVLTQFLPGISSW